MYAMIVIEKQCDCFYVDREQRFALINIENENHIQLKSPHFVYLFSALMFMYSTDFFLSRTNATEEKEKKFGTVCLTPNSNPYRAPAFEINKLKIIRKVLIWNDD